MGTNADSKAALPVSGNEAHTESTVEIKIKTLDSQTYTLRVDRYVSVPALKEQIANVTGVLSDQQRLICQGKVLKDDQLLSAYHVEDGHTLHLVVRQPIASQQTDASSSSRPNLVGAESYSNISENSQLRGSHVGRNILFGTIVSTVISSLGGNNVDGRGVSLSSRERPLDIHAMTSGITDPSNHSVSPEQESRSNQFGQHPGTTQLPTSASLGNQQPHQPTVIPDSLATLSQYIAHMKNEFDELCSSFQSGNVGEEPVSASGLNSGARRGLPTAASLADIMFLGRQLLIDQAGGCLYELASQLQGQTRVIDSQTRANIQSNALRSGVLFQNLGSLLLELGRAIMTLNMGQTPEEAVVNAGPAIFVSASGPNPIMVQAGTGLNSMSAGSTQGRAPTFGTGLLSRNIDVHIRRGPVLHAASVNEAEQTSRPQPSERVDVTSNSVDSFVQQILQGTADTPSPGDSSVHVVPIRTVFAIPAGIVHPPSDTFTSSDALTHPLFSRLREQLHGYQNNGNSGSTDVLPTGPNNQRAPNEPDLRLASVSRPSLTQSDENPLTTSMHVPAEESIPNQGSIVFSSLDTQGSTDYNDNDADETHGRVHNMNPLSHVFEALRSIFPGEQVDGNENGQTTSSQGQGPSSQEITDGIFFSNLLHQVMPFISRHATGQLDVESPNSNSLLEQDQRQDEAEARSCHDTSEEPVSKRQRM